MTTTGGIGGVGGSDNTKPNNDWWFCTPIDAVCSMLQYIYIRRYRRNTLYINITFSIIIIIIGICERNFELVGHRIHWLLHTMVLLLRHTSLHTHYLHLIPSRNSSIAFFKCSAAIWFLSNTERRISYPDELEYQLIWRNRQCTKPWMRINDVRHFRNVSDVTNIAVIRLCIIIIIIILTEGVKKYGLCVCCDVLSLYMCAILVPKYKNIVKSSSFSLHIYKIIIYWILSNFYSIFFTVDTNI